MISKSFTLVEHKLVEDKQTNKTVIRAMLYKIDDHYVPETDDNAILTLHFLSEKQLKLNDWLFER